VAGATGDRGVRPQGADPDIEVFVRAGCPHCEAAKTFLDNLHREHPQLRIVLFDIGENPDARQRLLTLVRDRGLSVIGVPAFLVGTELIIGFRSDETTGWKIRSLLAQKTQAAARPIIESIETAWFGRLYVRDFGLPLFTVVIGLLDGFNPCAMWALLFLLSLLVHLHDRFKMTLIAGTFVLVSGLMYFALMAAWLNVFLAIGLSRVTQVMLGCIACLMGALNVKDSFALHHGISLGIPESAKPEFYAAVRRILQAENLPAAMAGTVIVAGLANMIELLCTAGFPAIYTQILTAQRLPVWGYYGYLALYNLAYIFDDGLMVVIAVATLSRKKLQERAGRWLKLASGLVMTGLGFVLLLRPHWLL
ncbi:MAG: glutaredoxin family protein, partial [Nitrospira sp.]|nr:glutaredoxin family protein [Nitrospira sp.]